jgi:predicted secreted protein
MKELLADLQKKLEVEIENLKVAREQKNELANMLSKAQ